MLDFLPPVIAHRGASKYAPENTLSAFTKAAQLGAKWIEFDVMQAACGTPIIFHDEYLDRTTNDNGLVHQFPYTYLQTIDAGQWFDPIYAGEKIPSLSQVLAFLKNSNLSANIEIKSLQGSEEPFIKKILQEISLHTLNTTLLFSSFSISALRVLRKEAPHCLMGLLLHQWEHDWQALCNELKCVSLHVNHHVLTEEKAKKIKDLDKYLLCYTVNDPMRALQLFSWGVDAVFSDVPDKIINALK